MLGFASKHEEANAFIYSSQTTRNCAKNQSM
jgi:hypothetical protein